MRAEVREGRGQIQSRHPGEGRDQAQPNGVAWSLDRPRPLGPRFSSDVGSLAPTAGRGM